VPKQKITAAEKLKEIEAAHCKLEKTGRSNPKVSAQLELRRTATRVVANE
jgi:hypothetical protein